MVHLICFCVFVFIQNFVVNLNLKSAVKAAAVIKNAMQASVILLLKQKKNYYRRIISTLCNQLVAAVIGGLVPIFLSKDYNIH